MFASQPETQMLQLWFSHRRRMIYTVKPIADSREDLPYPVTFRGRLNLLAILIFFIATVIGAVGEFKGNESMGWPRRKMSRRNVSPTAFADSLPHRTTESEHFSNLRIERP